MPIVLLQNFGSAIASGACSRRGSGAVEAEDSQIFFSGFDLRNTPLRTVLSRFEHSPDIYDILINHPAPDYDMMIPISAYYFNTLSPSKLLDYL